MSKPTIIAVVGPTGSGKTDLAVKIAKEFNGIIISADSRQVYRGLDIGTNKEGEPIEWRGFSGRAVEGIPQLLIDVVEPGIRFTLQDWLGEARKAVKEIWAQGKLPIVVGGTGLYVSALLSNYQPRPDDPELRQELEGLNLGQLQKRAEHLGLNESDFQNPRRLIRAIEADGEERVTTNELPEFDFQIIEIERSREELYAKSDKRFNRIFTELMAEFTGLTQRGVDPEWLKEIGLDYRYAYLYHTHELSKEEAINLFNFRSHAYIRRQLTWWRHHEPTNRVKDYQEAQALLEKLLPD